MRPVVPDGEDRHRRPVVVIARDRSVCEVHDLSDLLGDYREHLVGRRALGDERRHAT